MGLSQMRKYDFFIKKKKDIWAQIHLIYCIQNIAKSLNIRFFIITILKFL